MKTTLTIVCNCCGVRGDLTIKTQITQINTRREIQLDGSLCPCGGLFCAPPGNYVRDDFTGKLERQGDYRPATLH